MKKMMFALLILLSNLTSAIEIQCMDGSTHVTVVTSQESGVTYLVMDDGENLLNYIPLNPENANSLENQFSYEDEVLSINLFADKPGVITSKEELYSGTSTLVPGECKFLK